METFVYYVSAVDGSRFFLMLGPFTEHAEALAMVDDCRNVCCERDPRAHFMAWGTCRDTRGKWGNANSLFPVLFP